MGLFNNREKKNRIVVILIMVIIGIIYFFMLGEKGMIFEKDSYAYLDYFESGSSAMPIYPYWLKMLELSCGDEYINLLFVPQGILAILVSILFSMYVCTRLELHHLHSLPIFVASLLPYGYTLPEYVVNHSVMTENLAIPAFYLFVISLVELTISPSILKSIISILLTIMLILTRMQMIFVMLTLLYVMWKSVYDKYSLKWGNLTNKLYKLSPVFLVIIGSLFFVGYIASIDGTSRNNQIENAMLGKALTIMEREDVKYYQDDEVYMFESIYSDIFNQERFIENARTDLLMWEDIVNFNNENMKLGFENIFHSAQHYNPSATYEECDIQMYRYMNSLTSREILHHPIKFIAEILVIMPSGLVSMVFIQKRSIYNICFIIGIFIWIVYVLMFASLYKKRAQKNNVFLPVLPRITFVLSMSNLIFSNSVLFGIQRYMIYTMGIIYISLYLMLYSYLKEKKDGKYFE